MSTALEKYLVFNNMSRVEALRNSLMDKSGNHTAAKNSVTNFMRMVTDFGVDKGLFSLQAFEADIQAFTRSSDLPEMYTGVYDVFNVMNNYDLRCERAFRTRQFDQFRNFFEIVDVTNYFTFDRLLEGEKVSIKYNTATSAMVKAMTYGDGLGWTWEMLEDREYSKMVDMAMQFRDSWYIKRGKILYGLIADAAVAATNANSGNAIAYNATGANILEKDILTLNTAIRTVANASKDLGLVPDVITAPYIVYCDPLYEDRLNAAIRQSTVNNATSVTTSKNVTVMPTFNLIRSNGTPITSTHAVVCLAGAKTQLGDKLLPTAYTATDVESFSEVMTVRARLGAAVGEPKQFVSMALA